MYSNILDAVIDIIQPLTDLPVRRGTLPAGDGVALEMSNTTTVSTGLDRSTVEELPCVLNCKSTDLVSAQDALALFHRKLTRLAQYPKTDRWQIYAIETISGPAVIGREADNRWLVGSSIRVKIYNKESAF